MRRLATTIAALIAIAASASAEAAEVDAFSSSAALLTARAEDVVERLGLEPMDDSSPVDAVLIDIMQELDLNQITDLLLRYRAIETKLVWSDHGSFAHLGVGVAVDRRLRDWLDKEGAMDREAVSFLLAHQQAHMMQFRVYSMESLADPDNAAALEAQADILAGMTIAQSRRFRQIPLRGIGPHIEKGATLARRFGHPGWYGARAHDARDRTRLGSVGVDAGNYYAEVWTCVTNLGKPETVSALKTAKRRALQLRRKNPSLPLFHRDTCVAGDPYFWTEQRAMREIAR